MDVLLSIKPRYADAILDGSKQYEFRRKIFKRKNINKVHMYSTSPIKRIVGTFTVGEIIEDHPRELWKRCSNKSGISEAEFFSYFEGVRMGYAIEIKDLERTREPVDPRSIFPNFSPPQSFCYCDVI